MGDDSSEIWHVTLSKEKLTELRDREDFQAILLLARIVNSLRFLQQALFHDRGADSPMARRQRASFFLYAGALLYEALTKFACTLGKHFKDLPEFKDGLGKLRADPSVERFRANVLDKVRNEAVYHHFVDVIRKGMDILPEDTHTFVSGEGPGSLNCYYDFADGVLLLGLFDMPDKRKLHDAIDKTIDLAKRFQESAEELIVAAIKSFGILEDESV